MKERLDSHFSGSGKGFWTWAVFFVSKDNSLNKAHVKYLEFRLIELAKAAEQSTLDNKQQPQPPTLSESEKEDTKSFLDDMLRLFPLLGLNVFERTEEIQERSNLLYLKARGIEATGYEDVSGFVVRKDSQLTKEVAPYALSVVTARKDLLERGVVREGEKHNVFAQDHVFDKPSGAARVILGRNTNGYTAWKNEEGKTLKELQTAATDEEEDDS